MKVLYEAGHFYAAKGPTEFSVIGQNVLTRIIPVGANVEKMLFIDDVHGPQCVPEPEAELPVVEKFSPDFDFIVNESQVAPEAFEVLEILKKLPGKKRARSKSGHHYFFKDFAVTTPAGQPACVLYDAGLSLYKSRLGFGELVNILPEHYGAEQRNLLRLLKTGLPQICQRVILFDRNGSWHELLLD